MAARPANISRSQWEACQAHAGAWLREALEEAIEAHAAVIFSHALPRGVILPELQAGAKAFERPILYLQADIHSWRMKQGQWAPNITHVVTDMMSEKYPALHVTVTTDKKAPFLFDRGPFQAE